MRAVIRLTSFFAAALTCAALSGSCADPVHDALVKSLGPEDPAIPPGEFHRAGQPCLACHGNEGPAKTQFAVAGTVFWHHTKDTIGVDQASVSMIDSLGANGQAVTNCVGNFFIAPNAWPGGNGPAFPMKASVYRGTIEKDMSSHINRAGSCAECHSDPANYNAVGHIWLIDDSIATPALPTDCPVDPTLVTAGSL
jgi:hypothetical protein